MNFYHVFLILLKHLKKNWDDILELMKRYQFNRLNTKEIVDQRWFHMDHLH